MIPAVSQRAMWRDAHVPAPLGGLNTVSAGTDMPLSDSIFSYNLIGAEFGLRTRLGWREWCTQLNGEQVRTIMPYTGSTKNGASNRLFVATTSGIWDCTASVVGPTRVVTFGVQNNDSGFGASAVFVTAAGHFLAYTDEANGYYTYTEATTTWTQVTLGGGGTQVSGVDSATFVHVCAWKNRLWFTVRDSGKAAYLALNAVYGAATAFTFGARFKYGGDLRGLWSWTGAFGNSLDDALVAVSGGGDVVVYQGTDPASASTFGLQGVGFLGAVPAGRRVCSDFGGDLLAMSSTGIISLSKVMIGTVLYDRTQYQTAKISNLWNQLQAATASLNGWSMVIHPLDSSLMVTVPTAVNQPTQQLAMSLATKGWHQYRDMPMGVCAAPWNGSLYFGTEDGRVCVNDGYLDGITLASPNVYTPISWSLLTAFSNLGVPRMKRLQSIRVKTLSQGGAVSLNAEARYNFDIREAAVPTPAVAVGNSVWDSALWDTGVWAGQYQPQSQIFGAAGAAQEVALAVRGSSTARMAVVGFDVAYDQGGWL